MKIWNGLALAAAVIAFSSCATPVAEVKTAFREDDLKPFYGNGTAAVTGQAFLKTRGGQVRYAAGNVIALLPDIPYTREVFGIAQGGKRPPQNVDYGQAKRKCIGDGTGNFEFKNIPAGRYLLFTEIYWETPGSSGLYRTGGVAHEWISVKDGETLKVILTR